MASPRAKGLFQRAIGESGGLFEPLQLGPQFLLANAERDGEKYAVSLGATSLQELRLLPANRLTGNAGGISHPMIEPYVLPRSPYEAFTSGQQNDVPLLIGSNSDEARAMVDVSHETAALFDSPTWSTASVKCRRRCLRHIRTRRTKRRSRPGSAWSATSALAGTCGPGRGCRPQPAKTLSTTTRFDSGHLFLPAPVYEGWGASHYAELWYVFDHLDQEPWRWSTADRNVAEEISSYWVNFAKSGNPNDQDLPRWPAFTIAQSEVQYLGDPITVGGVSNISGLTVFDAVYTTVRGKLFAAR